MKCIACSTCDHFYHGKCLQLNKQEANACVLSTVSNDSIPSSRVVLLKGVTDQGFIFFTNYNSSKGKDIGNNKNVALGCIAYVVT